MSNGYQIEIEGFPVGPRFKTREAAQAFAATIQAGTVVPAQYDPTIPEAAAHSAPEPQEMDPTRLPKEDR